MPPLTTAAFPDVEDEPHIAALLDREGLLLGVVRGHSDSNSARFGLAIQARRGATGRHMPFASRRVDVEQSRRPRPAPATARTS